MISDIGSLPVASIVVPVYNGTRTISNCIESLLVQDCPTDRYEVVIVNNSTDGTPDIAAKHPVTLLYEREIQTQPGTGASITYRGRLSPLQMQTLLQNLNDCVSWPGLSPIRGLRGGEVLTDECRVPYEPGAQSVTIAFRERLGHDRRQMSQAMRPRAEEPSWTAMVEKIAQGHVERLRSEQTL